MASAACLSPLCVGTMHQVRPVRECRHEGDREPVARWLAEACLVLDVVCQVAKRVALRLAAVVGDFFVAAGEGNGLKAEEADCPGIVERKLDDAAHLLIVDAAYDGGYGNDVDAGFVQFIDAAHLPS